MKLIRFLWQSSRALSIVAFALAVAGGLSSAGVLALIQFALRGESARTGRLVVWFVLLCASLCISRIGSQLLLVHLAQNGMLQLVMNLSRRIASTPLRHAEQLGAHRLIAALTDDVTSITLGLVSIPAAALSATIVVGCFFYLVWLSPLALVGLVVSVAAGAAICRPLFRWAEQFMHRARIDRDGLFSGFRSLIEGLKELKLNRRRRLDFFSISLLQRVESFRRNNLTATAIYTASGTTVLLLFYILLGAVLFSFPILLGLNRDVLTGYVVTLVFLMAPLDTLATQTVTIERGSFALGRLDQLGLSLPEPTTGSDNKKGFEENHDWQTIELRRVALTYAVDGEEGFSLGPIDLRIERGQILFFLGGNGSGKTTLAKIISGLYFPDSGEIRISGDLVTEANRGVYCEHFAAVFSDFHLFRELLGIPPVALERLGASYLRQLRMDRITNFENGRLSSIDLSSGQRRRLALLVALLEDKQIYIFDEWAADQDVTNRRVLYEEIVPSLRDRGKTVIIITHDEHYTHVADRLVRLESGRIVYDGPSSAVGGELLKSCSNRRLV